jgi:FRG domain
MSLNGQWIARYSGTNTGTGVIDIDEFDDHFSGTATAWDDNPVYASSLVRFRTSSKSATQHLTNLPVVHIDAVGNPLSEATINHMKANNISLPATVEIDLRLNGSTLSIQWSSSIGTSGNAVATAVKTGGGSPSDLVSVPVRGWDGFKRRINAIDQRRYIFRGQTNNKWRLRTSFHRTGRADLERYENQDIPDLLRIFSALTSHVFEPTNPLHRAALLNLAQHHGYPTPLLDWTWSPYVAAFFAFRHVKRNETSGKKVRIFQLDCTAWNELPRADKLFPYVPNLTVLNPLAFGNARAIPQQSISIVSNVDDIETHIQEVERFRGKKYIEVFDLAARDRERVMKELALMGITAGALFPGLDGACDSLKERNF